MPAMKDPARRINRVPPSRGEWVDLDPLTEPLLEPYPAAWYRRDMRESAIPKWLWDKWREDSVTSQWSPGDHALALELGRRSLRWRNRAESESAERANTHAREQRRLRIVKPEEEDAG
jgi:hypothetical protein